MRSLTIHCFILLSLFFPAFASAVTTMEASADHTVTLKTAGTVVAEGGNIERDRKIQTYLDAINASVVENPTQPLHLISSIETRLKRVSATESDSQQGANETILMDVLQTERDNLVSEHTAAKFQARSLSIQLPAQLSAFINPTSYHFGNVAVGSSSPTTVAITNTGNGALTFSAGYPMTDGVVAHSVRANRGFWQNPKSARGARAVARCDTAAHAIEMPC